MHNKVRRATSFKDDYPCCFFLKARRRDPLWTVIIKDKISENQQ